MTTTTPAATHYRLSIELSAHHAPDTRDGEPGEVVTLADLIATDSTTGRRFVYVGPAPCVTHGEALDLMARIFTWERSNDRTLDPTARRGLWVAEGVEPAAAAPAVQAPSVPATATPAPDAHAVNPVAQDAVAGTVAALVADDAVAAGVAAAVAEVAGGRRSRGKKVDAAKARRAKAVRAAGLMGSGVASGIVGVSVVGH